MLGGEKVGKSSLVSQFMTSEYLHAYDTSIGELSLFLGQNTQILCFSHSVLTSINNINEYLIKFAKLIFLSGHLFFCQFETVFVAFFINRQNSTRSGCPAAARVDDCPRLYK